MHSMFCCYDSYLSLYVLRFMHSCWIHNFNCVKLAYVQKLKKTLLSLPYTKHSFPCRAAEDLPEELCLCLPLPLPLPLVLWSSILMCWIGYLASFYNLDERPSECCVSFGPKTLYQCNRNTNKSSLEAPVGKLNMSACTCTQKYFKLREEWRGHRGEKSIKDW